MGLASIEEIRRMNLRRICEENGGVHVVCKATGIKQTQLIQYIGPNFSRNIGREFARRVEVAFGYDENWLDHLHDDAPYLLHNLIEFAQNLPPDKFEAFARENRVQIGQLDAARKQYKAIDSESESTDNVSTSSEDKQLGEGTNGPITALSSSSAAANY
jgi:hypothetical protein